MNIELSDICNGENMIFVSKEKAAESRKKRSEKRRARMLKESEELVKNYVYEGEK